jgi:hypothetical protein
MTHLKKHCTQMNQDERTLIETYAHSLPVYNWKNNMHVIDRMAEKRISDAEIILALRKGHIIEVHANNYPEIRYVVRHEIGNRAICVCASHKGNVVTVWANNARDNHYTLDASQYKWNVDLTRVFATLKG